jgi:hypothetical protein
MPPIPRVSLQQLRDDPSLARNSGKWSSPASPRRLARATGSHPIPRSRSGLEINANASETLAQQRFLADARVGGAVAGRVAGGGGRVDVPLLAGW